VDDKCRWFSERIADNGVRRLGNICKYYNELSVVDFVAQSWVGRGVVLRILQRVSQLAVVTGYRGYRGLADLVDGPDTPIQCYWIESMELIEIICA
jgi:hypothetical protein